MKYQLSVCLLTGDTAKETKDKTVVFNPYSSSRDSKVSGTSVITRAGLFESRLTLTQVLKSGHFSCIKTFLTTYVLCSLRLLKLKTEGKTIATENLTENCQTQIQILSNPGLA